MLRRLGLLVATTGGALAVAISVAGPAAAAPPSQSNEHDCRSTAVCNPGLHLGWDHHRNIGG